MNAFTLSAAPHPRSSASQQLLAVVRQKATVGAVDSSLKFALTALWNLTDETPGAARNFIQCRGLELYQEVLEVRTSWYKYQAGANIFPHSPPPVFTVI